jgi:deoxyuridine 5''-triphosphate nucleotidohydrolase (dut)
MNQPFYNQVKIRKLHNDAVIPKYQTFGAAGFDLCAIINCPEKYELISPGEARLFRTGLAFAIPKGKEMQIRPRSGLALKDRITVLNTPGTIDSDFRGEVGVILINHGNGFFCVNHGERIAQGVIADVVIADLIEVDELDETERGSSGFGHTGK